MNMSDEKFAGCWLLFFFFALGAVFSNCSHILTCKFHIAILYPLFLGRTCGHMGSCQNRPRDCGHFFLCAS